MCYRLHILNSLQLIRLFYLVATVSLSLFLDLSRHVLSPPLVSSFSWKNSSNTMFPVFFFTGSFFHLFSSVFDQPLNSVVSLRWPSLHHSPSVWLLSLISLRCSWWWVSLGHILRKRKASGFIKNSQSTPPLLPTSPHSIRISATLAR